MVAPSQVKQDTGELYVKVLPEATTRAFQRCAELTLFSDDKWYLAGGTALALQVGHRQSVDLDFFTTEREFDEKRMEKLMAEQGEWVTTSLSRGTLYGEFLGAKISFIAYPFFMPALPVRQCGSVRMLVPLDIAVMKIIAISQRGRKRDFFDLYWICRQLQPLSGILPRVHEQYTIHQNITHILKALVYFEDAENDPDPLIFFKTDWKEVKNFFKKEIPVITKRLIKLE